MNVPPRIALIGCGAVAEQLHLPAMAAAGVRPVLLVDKNLQRAQKLADAFHADGAAESYESALDRFDAAIVAVPNYLHAAVSIALLSRGKHVLVEKPMALTRDEANQMIDAARSGNAVLAVGLVRRYLHAAHWVKRAVEQGVLGRLQRVDIRDGNELEWAISSPRFFSKKDVGGGVFADYGAHALDLMLWWMGESVREIDYRDDAYGGVDADCELKLGFNSGAQGILELSRTRFLRNTARLTGEKGTIEVGVSSNTLRAEPAELLAHTFDGLRGDRLPEQPFKGLFGLELQDWMSAISSGAAPKIPGEEGLKSVEIIERAYATRKPIDFPWVTGSAKTTASWKPNGPGARPLVTGASGFIGGRLVEKLILEHRVSPRVQFRNYSHAARLARFDLDMVNGSLGDPGLVDRSVSDRDVVYHCAQDWYRAEANLDAARLLAEACLKHKVRRLVYVSSFVVHAPFRDGAMDEAKTPKPSGWAYADNKLAVEELLLGFARDRGLPVTILEPTVVYGPFSQGWSIELGTKLKTGRLVLPEGAGTSNAVYVDDVVYALMLAAQSDEAVGERFLIGGGDPLPWARYCAGYEKELGVQAVKVLPVEEYKALFYGTGAGTAVRSFRMNPRKLIARYVPKSMIAWAKKTMGQRAVDQVKRSVPPTLYKLSDMPLDAFMAKPAIDIGKSRKLLGFEPRFSFDEGMAKTGEFLRRYFS